MTFIRTVLGDIAPDELGHTLIHEHLLTSPPPYATQDDDDLEFGTPEGAAAELTAFARGGGGAICELTTVDYGRDVSASVAASEASGVHVVQATGFQKGIYYPGGTSRRDVDDLADQFAHDIEQGIDGGPARAGLIKVGTCSTEGIWEVEAKVIRASARAAVRTGAPVLTHTQAGHLGHQQLDLLLGEGLDPDQVCLGHLDRNIGWDYLSGLAERGCYLGLDQWTKDKYGPDAGRAEMVHRLVDAGHTRLTVSGDLGRGRYQPAYGGRPGFDGCRQAIREALADDAVADLVMVENPAKLLTFRGAAS